MCSNEHCSLSCTCTTCWVSYRTMFGYFHPLATVPPKFSISYMNKKEYLTKSCTVMNMFNIMSSKFLPSQNPLVVDRIGMF